MEKTAVFDTTKGKTPQPPRHMLEVNKNTMNNIGSRPGRGQWRNTG